MPAYVMAYAYTDWLQAAGPVQALLRDLTGWKVREYWFPEIRSLPGAAAMLSFALYPYVYLLARNAFLEQSRTTMEAARLAGYGAWGRFWRVALPLARTGIVAGTALALMEALADFGTVSYFAVNTFTAGIYRAWLVARRSGCGGSTRHLPSGIRASDAFFGAAAPRRCPLCSQAHADAAATAARRRRRGRLDRRALSPSHSGFSYPPRS